MHTVYNNTHNTCKNESKGIFTDIYGVMLLLLLLLLSFDGHYTTELKGTHQRHCKLPTGYAETSTSKQY